MSVFEEQLEGTMDVRLDSTADVYRPVTDRLNAERAVVTALADGEIFAVDFTVTSGQWSGARFIYSDDRVYIGVPQADLSVERYDLTFDVAGVLEKWPEGKPSYTVQEIALALNKRYGMSYAGILRRLDEAAQSGAFNLIDPTTDMVYLPDRLSTPAH